MSPGAIVTAAAIHIGLLWLLLQYSPLVPTVRYVVYQYVRPISPAPEANRAITIRPKAAARPGDAPAVFSNTPESSLPMQATAQLPQTLQPQQRTVPRAAQPKPIPQRRTDTTRERAPEPVPAPVAPPVPVPPVAAPEIEPAPAVRPVPQPLEPAPPAPVPAPDTLPAPVPAPGPVPDVVPQPAPQPPVPAPAPPAAAPQAPPPAPQRLQGPVIDVPVAPGSPAAGAASPVLVPQPAPGWGEPAPAPAAPALPSAPVLAPAIPPHPGPYRVAPRRTVSEMANAQLQREKKDPLAADVEDASVDDCMHASDKESAISGLLNAPVVAARALTGRCAK